MTQSGQKLISRNRTNMVQEQRFIFESDRGFLISGVGLIFVGHVRNGVASAGDRLQVEGRGGQFTGTIRAIEYERKIHEQTIDGEEITIALNEISGSKVMEILDRPDPETLGIDDPESFDQNAEFAEYGLIFPVVLTSLIFW